MRKIEIQLRRQGVARTLRGWFLPCEHGDPWHIEIMSCWDGGVRVELSYPNCHICFGPTELQPEWDGVSNKSHTQWRDAIYQWKTKLRSGQVAWSNSGPDKPRGYLQCKSLQEGKAQALEGIERVVKVSPSFADSVEAYMCYSDGDYTGYPYLERDVFFAACYYDERGECIVTPGGLGLVWFENSTVKVNAVIEVAPYMPAIERAIPEFEKVHVQRDGKRRSRTWFAWLLSEYIKKDLPGCLVEKRSRMIELAC